MNTVESRTPFASDSGDSKLRCLKPLCAFPSQFFTSIQQLVPPFVETNAKKIYEIVYNDYYVIVVFASSCLYVCTCEWLITRSTLAITKSIQSINMSLFSRITRLFFKLFCHVDKFSLNALIGIN